MISRMGTRILGCDPATYTLRDAGKGSVVRVDDGVAVWSALAGRPSLLFGARVRSRCGVLMVGSFLRMTGYGVVDRSLMGEIKKATSGEGMRPEKSHCAASLRWYYPGQV